MTIELERGEGVMGAVSFQCDECGAYAGTLDASAIVLKRGEILCPAHSPEQDGRGLASGFVFLGFEVNP